MINLYFWPTANGYKPLILLEELEATYTLKSVNIMRGEQRDPHFRLLSTNGKIPVIVDGAPSSGRSVTLFESGAILVYLAEKAGRFMPHEPEKRAEVLQWVFWQVGGLGPMMGQAAHFMHLAPEDLPYAKKRYRDESLRLLGVLNARLEDREFVAGEYSIADMAIYPWVKASHLVSISLADYPRIEAWTQNLSVRPAVVRAYTKGEAAGAHQPLDEEAKRQLSGVSPSRPETPPG